MPTIVATRAIRNAALFVSLSLFGLPLFASSSPLQPHRAVFANGATVMRVESKPGRLQEVLSILRKQQVGAAAVTDHGPARAVLIPTAGNAQGDNGTWYRSDVTVVLHSLSTFRQNVLVVWMPQGNPAGTAEFIISMNGYSDLSHPDFVGTALGVSGIGALLFVPLDDHDQPDPSGAIDASSRIWTPAGGGLLGTVSLQFPGLDVAGLFSDEDVRIYGMRVSNDFRASYSIVNLSDVNLTFEVTVDPDDDLSGGLLERITVRAGELVRRSIPATGIRPDAVLGIRSLGPVGKIWSAYGSSTDNGSNDGWVSIASRTDAWSGALATD